MPNPLFQDLDPDDDVHGRRTSDLVYVAGIVGVPWQDIARDQCLNRPLMLGSGDQVSCFVLEARVGEGTCSCDPAVARLPVDPKHTPALEEARKILNAPASSAPPYDCFCEIPQLDGEEQVACRTDVDPNPALNGKPLDGWCYVDPALGHAPKLIEECKLPSPGRSGSSARATAPPVR